MAMVWCENTGKNRGFIFRGCMNLGMFVGTRKSENKCNVIIYLDFFCSFHTRVPGILTLWSNQTLINKTLSDVACFTNYL